MQSQGSIQEETGNTLKGRSSLMRSELEVETNSPSQLKTILEPSLSGNNAVNHDVKTSDRSVKIQTQVDTIGQLRGGTDGVLRLLSLSKKILEEQ
jgi:tRNA threonylcarbamoyladenosine modification (KEOPS) complex  Pcc1 subunit